MTTMFAAMFGGWEIIMILAVCLVMAFMMLAVAAILTWLVLKLTRQNQRILEQNRKV